MASRKFKIDAELYKRITELQSDLDAAAQELRDEFDDRSERWQESDAGMAADAWIESLALAAEELESVTEEPEG